jgi:hypothetical protein
MREPVTRKDDDQDPAQLVAEIRHLAAEVWRRVQEWHDSPDWQDTERNRHRYDLTARTIAAFDDRSDPEQPVTVNAMSKVLTPILTEWRPALAGPEQAIYAAVDRLRTAIGRIRNDNSS